MDDLKRAIDASEQAVNATPSGHPELALHLGSLGNWLGSRFEWTGSTDDRTFQLSSYAKAFKCSTSPPSVRIYTAQQAANTYKSQENPNWDELYHLLRGAVNLLPKISQRALRQTDMQSMLAPTSGIASDAAAAALNAQISPLDVLSPLELGRGVIAGLLIDMRGDTSALREAYPELADRFTALRNELDTAPTLSSATFSIASTAIEPSTINRRYTADRELDETIESIRAKDGFSDFLLPPSAETLAAAADPGPVIVINVSIHRCDAILVERTNIRVLNLPGLTLKEVNRRVLALNNLKSNIEPLLEWLWKTICCPCLDALGFIKLVCDDQWPRVWVPTSHLSQLPLHAAGLYTPGSREKVLDRLVSSYAHQSRRCDTVANIKPQMRSKRPRTIVPCLSRWRRQQVRKNSPTL